MNWLDILIVLMIALPAFFGFRKGFLRKLLGIAGIIAGFILAVKFYDSVAGVLSAFIKGNPVFVDVLSFLLIIGILYGTSVWLARFMANMNSGTTLIDKILGTVFGFLQGLIIASVLLFNLALADMPSKETRESSMFYPQVYGIAPAIFDKVLTVFPGLQDVYNEYLSPKKDTRGSEPKHDEQKQQQKKK